MLVKDEMKFEQKLNQGDSKILPTKKDMGNRKKKLIALREVRHMLDEVSTRRTILCKENQETRRALDNMRQALTSMPKEVKEARAKLMSCDRKSKEKSMANENIREAIYAMNLTISSMPIIVAASTATSLSQQALCNTLISNVQQHPCGQHNLPLNVPILPLAPRPTSVPSDVTGVTSSLAAKSLVEKR